MDQPSFIRLKAVLARTGKSKSSVYRLIKENGFPRPYKIGKRAVAWLNIEIDYWIASTVARERPNEAVLTKF
jgi:prophage regulatory protein